MGGKLTRRVLLAAVIASFMAAPASAAAAPVWEIEAAWAPAHLPPGGTGFFYGEIKNRGDASTSAVTVTTTLPAGVTATDADGGVVHGGGSNPVAWTCLGTGTSTVTCSTTDPIEAVRRRTCRSPSRWHRVCRARSR